jgi:HK97 family phage portal protein
MPILANFVTASRVRRSGANPSTDTRTNYGYPYENWDARRAGVNVSDSAALSLTAVYRAVTLIAQTLAGLPFQVFEETINDDGTEGPTRKLKTRDTAYLWRRPNPEMTHQTFWERVFADEIRGNAYVWVEKDANDAPAALWYIDRNRVVPGRTRDGVKVYEIDGYLPMIDYKAGGEIVHFPNWGGAIAGYDPIRIAPQALALNLSAEDYASRAFSTGSIPPGALTTEQELDEPQSEVIRARWESNVGGRNQGRIAVLSHGTTFQKISQDLETMQNLETRGFGLGEVERLFGLPAHLLADTDKSTSWGTGIEEQNRNLTTFNFQGHINRIQEGASDDLLVRELTNRYLRLNTAGLLRGNTLTRFQAYKLADFMTVDEKRALEEMPPLPDGRGADLLLAPGTTTLDALDTAAMGASEVQPAAAPAAP